MPLDSPLLSAARGGRAEGRSPGIATLKEAFDVTYAVHRMEEEGARRRKYKGAGGRGFLTGLNEDNEEEDDDSQPPSATVLSAGLPSAASIPPNTPNTPTSARRRAPKGFELDMDGATLLERRHKRTQHAVGLSSPLSGKPAGSIANPRALDPGSPMRVV